jgi:hypothetical protein
LGPASGGVTFEKTQEAPERIHRQRAVDDHVARGIENIPTALPEQHEKIERFHVRKGHTHPPFGRTARPRAVKVTGGPPPVVPGAQIFRGVAERLQHIGTVDQHHRMNVVRHAVQPAVNGVFLKTGRHQPVAPTGFGELLGEIHKRDIRAPPAKITAELGLLDLDQVGQILTGKHGERQPVGHGPSQVVQFGVLAVRMAGQFRLEIGGGQVGERPDRQPVFAPAGRPRQQPCPTDPNRHQEQQRYEPRRECVDPAPQPAHHASRGCHHVSRDCHYSARDCRYSAWD